MTPEEIYAQMPFHNVEFLGLTGYNLMYAACGAVALTIFLGFLIPFIIKGGNRMAKPEYFDEVIRRELTNAANGEEIIHYIDAGWRGSWIGLFGKYYYVGLTKTNFILLKVKGSGGNFYDTNKNETVVNIPMSQLQDLKIIEGQHTEKWGGCWTTWDVEKISFVVDGKKFKLIVKYGGLHGSNDQLQEICEEILRQNG